MRMGSHLLLKGNQARRSARGQRSPPPNQPAKGKKNITQKCLAGRMRTSDKKKTGETTVKKRIPSILQRGKRQAFPYGLPLRFLSVTMEEIPPDEILDMGKRGTEPVEMRAGRGRHSLSLADDIPLEMQLTILSFAVEEGGREVEERETVIGDLLHLCRMSLRVLYVADLSPPTSLRGKRCVHRCRTKRIPRGDKMG